MVEWMKLMALKVYDYNIGTESNVEDTETLDKKKPETACVGDEFGLIELLRDSNGNNSNWQLVSIIWSASKGFIVYSCGQYCVCVCVCVVHTLARSLSALLTPLIVIAAR